MSKIDFNALVESLLQLESKSVFLQNYGSKIPGTDDNVLTTIYQFLTPGQKRYISGDAWEPYTKFTPLFSAIVYSLSPTGTFQGVRDALSQKFGQNQYTEDEFYNLVEQNINKYSSSIKEYSTLSSQERKKLAKDVLTTHNAAVRKQSKDVLIQNVWPTIENLTIVDSVTTLLKNRLTRLENLKLHFVVPLNTMQTPMIDGLMKDVLYNLEAYSTGSKKYSADIVEVLQNINVIPEDFVKIGTYTVQLYKQLIVDKFGRMADKVLQESLTNDNIYNLAKTGNFVYIVNGQTKTPNANDKYILNFIENLNIEPGNNLIEQIKSMSSGIRVKDQAWQKFFSQRLGYATQTASAIAGAAGAKLYN